MPEKTEPEDDKARVLAAERHQVELREFHLDSAVAADHRVRGVWSYVEALDLSPLYARIGSVEGGAGRPVDRQNRSGAERRNRTGLDEAVAVSERCRPKAQRPAAPCGPRDREASRR